jgi:predicted dehydrogenase
VDSAGAAMAALAGQSASTPVSPTMLASLVKPSKPIIANEEPLRAELRSFLDSVRRRTTPVVSLEDGLRALAVALEILAAIEQHSERVNLASLWQ